jgi:hypothetical protein
MGIRTSNGITQPSFGSKLPGRILHDVFTPFE